MHRAARLLLLTTAGLLAASCLTHAQARPPRDTVRRSSAYIEMNERGHFFSEGSYDILVVVKGETRM